MIRLWYIFMLRGLFWHTDRVFCCSTLKPAPISVKVAVKIIIIMRQFRLKFYCSTLKSAPISVKVSVIIIIRSWGIGLLKYWKPCTTGRLHQIMLKFNCLTLESAPISVKVSMIIIIRSWGLGMQIIMKGKYVQQEDYDFFHFGNNIPKNTDNLCNLNHTIRQL